MFIFDYNLDHESYNFSIDESFHVTKINVWYLIYFHEQS